VAGSRAREEKAMEYVVQIADAGGHVAVKEYEANSPYELVSVVRYDLKSYPNFRVLNAWRKGEPDRAVYLN
jgi:hypothetical protein